MKTRKCTNSANWIVIGEGKNEPNSCCRTCFVGVSLFFLLFSLVTSGTPPFLLLWYSCVLFSSLWRRQIIVAVMISMYSPLQSDAKKRVLLCPSN